MKAFANLDKEGQIRRSKHCATGCIFIAILIIGLLIYGNMYVSHKEALCTSTVSGTIYSTHIGGKYSKPTVSAKYIIDGKRYYTTGEGYYSYSKEETMGDRHYGCILANYGAFMIMLSVLVKRVVF